MTLLFCKITIIEIEFLNFQVRTAYISLREKIAFPHYTSQHEKNLIFPQEWRSNCGYLLMVLLMKQWYVQNRIWCVQKKRGPVYKTRCGSNEREFCDYAKYRTSCICWNDLISWYNNRIQDSLIWTIHIFLSRYIIYPSELLSGYNSEESIIEGYIQRLKQNYITGGHHANYILQIYSLNFTIWV